MKLIETSPQYLIEPLSPLTCRHLLRIGEIINQANEANTDPAEDFRQLALEVAGRHRYQELGPNFINALVSLANPYSFRQHLIARVEHDNKVNTPLSPLDSEPCNTSLDLLPFPDDLVAAYKTDALQVNLLTREQELQLAYMIKASNEAFDRLNQDDILNISPRQISELVALVAAGVKPHRLLVQSNLRLVFGIAVEFTESSSLDFIDLIQEGNIGLIQAAAKYDPDCGTKFSTFATRCIKSAIVRAIENTGYLIGRPVHVSSNLRRFHNIFEKIWKLNGSEPTIEVLLKDELVKAQNWGRDDVQDLLMLYQQEIIEIDKPHEPFKQINIDNSYLPEPPEEIEIQAAINFNLKSFFSNGYRELTVREQAILWLHYGYGYSWTEIEKFIYTQYGEEISRQRVSQIAREVSAKLRRNHKDRIDI
jgi:RNA polymerase primary sigma factor